MESATDFINRYFDGRLKLNGELEEMLESRDAAIRKECADRAVAWYLNGLPDYSEVRAAYADEVASLRAAIENKESKE